MCVYKYACVKRRYRAIKQNTYTRTIREPPTERMYMCMHVCTYISICFYVCMYVCMYMISPIAPKIPLDAEEGAGEDVAPLNVGTAGLAAAACCVYTCMLACIHVF